MEDRKVDELINLIDKFEKENLIDGKSSREFLRKAGIVKQNGELEENFKDLCIPQGQV
ncbi:hypothetical protein OGH69_13400 [Flavobacterium sp. MFBS3-15]|uniref:hypothetical protein n=1 Tax=Flavobacterium sp. MFBS3-15 TaxID=2989816 RepID=UPI002235B291|nr:hypothetical protein [Flavobacterium sp. MFBS3-15]MCW4469968.1 hypothetical protein [Flavobacterium sp. MFBS3-15]